MKRSRVLYPDTEYHAPDGEVFGVVSREAVEAALLDMAAVCDLSGGGFTVAYWRKATGVPNERVTTGVMLEWKDRTDARSAPEADQQAIVPEVTPEPPEPDPDDPVATEAVIEEDGLNRADLEEEDTSSIPAGAL